MKALDWHRFLQAQHEQHGKVVFTVTELANAAQASPRVLNVELARLIKRGVIVKYARGRYGAVRGVSPEDVLPFLDTAAYLTGLYALHRHDLITQLPREITCFTNRRHNRSRERLSPLGRFVFVCVGPQIYTHPADGWTVGPEQALCDFLYLTCRQSLDARTLVTFRNLNTLDGKRLRCMLDRYPQTVSRAFQRLERFHSPLLVDDDQQLKQVRV